MVFAWAEAAREDLLSDDKLRTRFSRELTAQYDTHVIEFGDTLRFKG